MVTSTDRSGGHSAVAAVTKSWTGLPAVVNQVESASAMRAGLWASMMVEVAARPGQAPLGPPLHPAKKWGSTKPVRMRRSAAT